MRPATLQEYCTIQINSMGRWLLATPALDYVILNIHDNDCAPVMTRRIQRKGNA